MKSLASASLASVLSTNHRRAGEFLADGATLLPHMILSYLPKECGYRLQKHLHMIDRAIC